MKFDPAQLALLNVIKSLNFQKSLYVYGGVGTGKTMMMKRFYESCSLDKQYSHFHEYMRDFHKNMHALRNTASNKNGTLVEQIVSQQPRVLCFDEFQVTDISDAMVLYNILRNVWNQNKFVFFTSNRHPSELYSNGIQRDSFLPCIDLILSNSIVHRLDNQTDYRKQKKLDRGYLVATEENKVIFDRILSVLTNGEFKIRQITHSKRSIPVRCHKNIALFEFNELCDANLGASDYLEIASNFNTVFLKSIPQLDMKTKSQARRFITLVDALYERHCSCIFLAEKLPLDLFNGTVQGENKSTMLQEIEIDFDAYKSPLFTGEEELFAFQRAASRLIEMSHFDYMNDAVKRAIMQVL
eukprot:NODE_700_length_5043_cov_0.336367.p1 type:complete len:355 gc:universal NODE_700_length_5043_cov_0.336367:1587-2651(+)